MPRRKAADPAALEERLGYHFQDQALLALALTHVSAPRVAKGRSYQRLEFLGDRVLGLAVADMLYRRFPEAPEGELSQRLAELVRKETCAEVALAWDLGPHLKLGPGEAHSGGRRKLAILADVCEAVLGAAFLDGGFDAARSLVERGFSGLLLAPRRLRDPKTALQEWAQGRGLPPPVYAIAAREGPDHAPRFRVSAEVKGIEAGFGLGTSRRAAEQEAARGLLIREGVWTEEADGTGS